MPNQIFEGLLGLSCKASGWTRPGTVSFLSCLFIAVSLTLMTCASGVNLLCQCARARALRAQQLQRRMRPERRRSSHGALCWIRWPSPTGTHSATFLLRVESPSEWPSLRKLMHKDVLFLPVCGASLLMMCGCYVVECAEWGRASSHNTGRWNSLHFVIGCVLHTFKHFICHLTLRGIEMLVWQKQAWFCQQGIKREFKGILIKR